MNRDRRQRRVQWMGGWASLLVVLYTLLPTMHAIECDSQHLEHHATHDHPENPTLHTTPAQSAAAEAGTTLPHDCGFCRILSHASALGAPAAALPLFADASGERTPDLDSGRPAASPRHDDLGRGPPTSHS